MSDQELSEAKLVDEALSTPKNVHIDIRVPARHNPILQQVIDRVNADEELYAL